ncbi:MAG: DUF2071 domain-containing protein [Salinibacter sp.]
MALLSSPPRILRAVARDRAAVAWAVDPALVAPHLPTGLRPDTRGGTAYVRLVGVRLAQVRVLGLAGPGFRRVPAVELQVLVREAAPAARRGTLTIQAHVPRRLVAWGARGLYGEPVAVAQMQPVRRDRAEAVEITYRFDVAGREQRLRVAATGPPSSPSPGTLPHFLRDRSWRYGTARDGTLLRARIERETAPIRRADEPHVTVRWAAVYGEPWTDLEDRTPAAALVSPGGALALRWRERVA